MSKIRPTRGQPERSFGQPEGDVPEPSPPRRRMWLLVAGIVLWICWLAFLLMMAVAAE
jgi:hypothetical protein